MPLLEIINASAVLLAVVAAFWQIRMLRHERKTEAEREQRGRALEYSLTRAPHLRKLRVDIDCAFDPSHWGDRTIQIGDLTAVFDRDENVRPQLIALLAHWENLALTVASGVTDEDMAFEMVASTLVSYEHRFSEFIESRRADQSRRLYAYLTPLAERWRRRLVGPDAARLFAPSWPDDE